MPQKLDTNNWFQDNKTKSSHHKEVPPCNLRFVLFNRIIGYRYSKIFDETLYRGENSVGAKASIWKKFADGHREKQELNPFSDTFDKEKLKSLLCSKDDPNYGRPDRFK